MTTAQLRYRQAGARGDLTALLTPYVVPMPQQNRPAAGTTCLCYYGESPCPVCDAMPATSNTDGEGHQR